MNSKLSRQYQSTLFIEIFLTYIMKVDNIIIFNIVLITGKTDWQKTIYKVNHFHKYVINRGSDEDRYWL